MLGLVEVAVGHIRIVLEARHRKQIVAVGGFSDVDQIRQLFPMIPEIARADLKPPRRPMMWMTGNAQTVLTPDFPQYIDGLLVVASVNERFSCHAWHDPHRARDELFNGATTSPGRDGAGGRLLGRRRRGGSQKRPAPGGRRGQPMSAAGDYALTDRHPLRADHRPTAGLHTTVARGYDVRATGNSARGGSERLRLG